MNAAKTPVSIVTGFLGAGKTTLLNHVLADPRMAGTAVIINEFGEIPLDHLLVATPAENTVLLRSGCLCCTIRGDLVETLADLYRKRACGAIPSFERVLVETTGLADPVPILRTLATDEEIALVFGLDSIVTLIDAVNAGLQLDGHAEAVKQAAVADLLALSKADLADGASLEALQERLRRLNPGAQQLHVRHGAIDCLELFGATPERALAGGRGLERWLGEGAFREAAREDDRAPLVAGRGGARHDRRIQAFCVRHEAPVAASGLLAWLNLLAGLKGANLLRVKALVNVEGQPVAVHAVQTVVHEPAVLDRWPSEDRASRFVFIVRDMTRAEIERTLQVLALGAVTPRADGLIDPQQYARFAAAAAQLTR